MKKIILILLFSMLILSSCSGLPYGLKKAADKDLSYFAAEVTHITEAPMFDSPKLTDQLQVTEDKWCLTYEISSFIWVSTLWEKQDRVWVRTDIKPYFENCNWAR